MTSRRGTRRPFTIVLCQRCHDARRSALLELLGAAVRDCPHGMLITSQCWSHDRRQRNEPFCTALTFARGPRIVLQPCAADRLPNAPTIWLGPITSDDDARAVCEWIVDGVWDPNALPTGLPMSGTASRSPLLN